jgi:hypothetical protein
MTRSRQVRARLSITSGIHEARFHRISSESAEPRLRAIVGHLVARKPKTVEGEQPWTRTGFEWESESDGETSRKRSNADRVRISRSTLTRPWDRTGLQSPQAYLQIVSGTITASRPGSEELNCPPCRSESSSWTWVVRVLTVTDRTASTSTAMRGLPRSYSRPSPVSCWPLRWSRFSKLLKEASGTAGTPTEKRSRGCWRR